MTEVNNRATFIGFGKAGVAYYRSMLPAKALGEGLFIRDDKTLAPVKVVGEINADVIVYSQPHLDFQIAECLEVLDGGGKLIIDCDDDLRVAAAKDDLMIQLDEDAVKKWETMLTKATLVSCSTQHIADSLTKRLGVETMVCPNGIDLKRFNIQKLPRNKDSVVIGWSGGVGHKEAFERIAPAIEAVMDARDDVLFVSIGEVAPGVMPSSLLGKYADSDRVADAGWYDIYDYPVIMSQFHIALAPAVDNDFYRGKSDIKLLEYAASYVYPIVQGPTYDAAYHTPGPIGAYLTAEADVDAWRDTIMSVIANPKERYKTGLRARKWVANNRTYTHTADAWKAAIDRALEAG